MNQEHAVRGRGRSYYPRALGMASPPGASICELLTLGKELIDAPAGLAAVVSKHRLKLIPSGGYQTYEPGKFVWTTFLDFSESSSSVEDLLKDLRRLDFVTHTEACSMTDSVFDNFLFPVTIMGSHRVVVFRLEPLLRVEKRLIETFGSGGETIMFEEGMSYATETVGQYLEALPKATPAVLLENIKAGLRATGWGLFEFDLSKLRNGGQARVTVTEPPNAALPGVAESAFTNGIVAGILQSITGERMRVVRSMYDDEARMLSLWLEEMSPRPRETEAETSENHP